MKTFTLLIYAAVLSLTTLPVSANNDKLDTQQKVVLETSMSQHVQQPININQADQATLSTLKGIGVQRAKAIIEYRKNHGKFKTIEDLMKISGIGKGFISKYKDRLVI
jgi:comEA protein